MMSATRNIITLGLGAIVNLNALALSPSVTGSASTVQIYMAGSSSLADAVKGLFAKNCSSASIDIYSAGSPLSAGTQSITSCTLLSSGLPADLASLAGKNVAFYQSYTHGATQSLNQVVNGIQRSFLSVASCGARSASVPNYTCSTTSGVIPNFAITDMEPRVLMSNLEDDLYLTLDYGSITQTPIFQTVYGVAVTKSLYRALQTAQGLTQDDTAQNKPSLNRAVVVSYLSGIFSGPSDGNGWQRVVSSSDSKKGSQINICRRTKGSGTQAAANAYFFNVGCSDVAGAPLQAMDNNPGSQLGLSGDVHIAEGVTGGDVISCMSTVQSAGAYGIGHLSLQEASDSEVLKFIKLNGAAPSRENVKTGLYEYFYEATAFYKNATFSSLSIDQRNLIEGFILDARTSAAMSTLPTAVQQGIVAMQTGLTSNYGTGSAAELTFLGRTRRFGDSCSPLSAYQ